LYSKYQNRSVNEIFVSLTFYEAQNGSLLPTFRDNLSDTSSLTAGPLKIGFDRLSRKVDKTTIIRFRKILEQRRSRNLKGLWAWTGIIYFIHYRAQRRRALMNTLMKLRVPQEEGTSWSCEWLSNMISVINSTISGDCHIENVICIEKSWNETSHNCARWRHKSLFRVGLVNARARGVPTGLWGISLIPEQTVEVSWILSILGIQFSIMREGKVTFSPLFTARLSALRKSSHNVRKANRRRISSRIHIQILTNEFRAVRSHRLLDSLHT